MQMEIDDKINYNILKVLEKHIKYICENCFEYILFDNSILF